MGKTARLRLTYRKGSGPKQKLDHQGPRLSPEAVSLHAGDDASKQIEKQGTKRKRSRMSELEKLAMDEDEDEDEDEEGSDSDEPKVSYVSKGRGRPRGSKKRQFLAPTGRSERSPRPRRNLRRPDCTMRANHDIVQSSATSSIESTRSPSPTPREIYESLNPVFIEFPCRWRGCNASLTNLETLKKHLHVVHSAEAREHLRCQWDKCGQLKTPVVFSKLSDVDSHVMERHIREVAWKLGDGIGSSVAGGPVVPDFSVKPPLRLFRKEEPAENMHKGKKSADDAGTDI